MLNIQQTLKIVSIILCIFALKISTLLCSDNAKEINQKSKKIPEPVKCILNPFVKRPNAIDIDHNKTSISNLFPELLTNILQFDTEFNTRKLERYITDHTDYLLEPYEPFTVMQYHPLFFTNKAFYKLRIKVSKNHHTDGSNPFFFIRYLPFFIKSMPTHTHASLNLYILHKRFNDNIKHFNYDRTNNSRLKKALETIKSCLSTCAIDYVSSLDNFPIAKIESQDKKNRLVCLLEGVNQTRKVRSFISQAIQAV